MADFDDQHAGGNFGGYAGFDDDSALGNVFDKSLTSTWYVYTVLWMARQDSSCAVVHIAHTFVTCFENWIDA